MRMKTVVWKFIFAMWAIAAPWPLKANDAFPTRTVATGGAVRPGSVPDTVARILASKLGEKWRQGVITRTGPAPDSTLAPLRRAHGARRIHAHGQPATARNSQ